jgi:CDP-6-deoxy-D-xylo-4-hexulose-3-dehydrase
MISKDDIKTLVGDHVPPHMYNKNVFKKGETPVFYSGMYWDHRETEAAIDAFLNGQWISAGEYVHKFEQTFNKIFNHKYSLMVNSGSSANLVMIAALKKMLGWNDDSEVIVSPTGFPTTISVLYQNRLNPVFIDIEWNTLNFDLNKIEKKINIKTKAIFLSPVLGNPPDMDRLIGICNKNQIKLIIDNCDSLGSKWDNKYLTEYGIASSESFYPAHHISTGEGGMISTNNEELHKLMVSIAWWGRDCFCIGSNNLLGGGSCGKRFDKWLKMYNGIVDHKYIYSNMGYNLKPLDLQGAIGLVQLDKFPEIMRRRQIAKETIENIVLNNIKGIKGVKTLDKADVSWFGTPFICDNTELHHKLVQHFESHKIQTRNYFAGNILMHPGYEFLDDYKNYPEANKVLDKVFFLGSAPHYSASVFEYIEEVVKKF